MNDKKAKSCRREARKIMKSMAQNTPQRELLFLNPRQRTLVNHPQSFRGIYRRLKLVA